MSFRNVQVPRCHGPRCLTGYTLEGSEIVILENELLRVVVNAGRGAMIPEFLYKPADLDVLFKNPNGLRPQNSVQPSSHESPPLHDFHPGGWSECFPNGPAAATVNGARLGSHGEVWGLPFEITQVSETDEGCSVTLSAVTVRTPFKLTKTFSMRTKDPTLYIEEIASNLSAQDIDVLWGQHPILGAPFLDEHCYVDAPCRGYFDTKDEPILRLRWPHARDGRDESRVAAPASRSGKLLYLTDFSTGKVQLVSPTWGLAFEMQWDASLFPYCWMWENAGVPDWPWWGRAYGLALQPFTGLKNAHDEGHGTLTIPGGKSQTVRFEARIVERK